jgi:hypothetical protein
MLFGQYLIPRGAIWPERGARRRGANKTQEKMMSELARADDGACEHTRLVRRYRRQLALAVALALAFFLREYVPLGDIEPWMVRLQLALATALVLDVLVRPALRRIVPTTIIFQYNKE